MHTFNADEGTTFHHNGSFDGDVIITTKDNKIKIPFNDIKELVASYVRSNKIYGIEEMNDDELLGL